MTEWDLYKELYDSMRKPAHIYDGRNILNQAKIREIGFNQYRIGKRQR
ncbi:MAG: hypothetical protein PF445_03890 [Melioribacteraceae bacterium]|jgi:UDPglucose 6-dehydrogenase|nr:hypothetical protein [Melioribacteraceae bacterium]